MKKRLKTGKRQSKLPAVFSLSLLAIYCAVATSGSRAHAAVSLTQERVLGERFSLLARRQMPLLREPAVGVFVTALGRRLLAPLGETNFSYRFFVVEDQSLNAFAVPGGYVYVNAGLLAEVESVSELAGVLAHEIVHVHMHHMARQYEKTQMVSYASLLGMLLGAVHPAIAAGAATVGATTQLRYRREFEQEADLLGSDYMVKASFDPAGMVSFLSKIERQQRLNPTQLPPYLLSHPLTPDRIVQLGDKVKRVAEKKFAEDPVLRADLYRTKALVRARMEPQGKVIADYQAEAAQDSARPEAAHGLGLVYATVGQVEKALPYLRQAARQAHPHARADLGLVLVRLGKEKEAEGALRKALAEDPADAVAQVALAKIEIGQGKVRDAMQLLRSALAANPELDEAEYALAQCLGRLGEEKEQWLHLAEAFTLRGEFERAINALRKAYDLAQPASAEREEIEKKAKLIAEALSQNEE